MPAGRLLKGWYVESRFDLSLTPSAHSSPKALLASCRKKNNVGFIFYGTLIIRNAGEISRNISDVKDP